MRLKVYAGSVRTRNRVPLSVGESESRIGTAFSTVSAPTNFMSLPDREGRQAMGDPIRVPSAEDLYGGPPPRRPRRRRMK